MDAKTLALGNLKRTTVLKRADLDPSEKDANNFRITVEAIYQPGPTVTASNEEWDDIGRALVYWLNNAKLSMETRDRAIPLVWMFAPDELRDEARRLWQEREDRWDAKQGKR